MNKPLVDTRGLVCPEPMLMVKRAMDQQKDKGVIEAIADTAAARENIKRLAQSRGWQIQVEEKGEEIFITLTHD